MYFNRGSLCKLLKIMYLVEAAGVELFQVLTTRNLLILGTATTAKKAPLPDPLYVYCTKIFSHCDRVRGRHRPSIPHFAGIDKKNCGFHIPTRVT